ncbi:hypothetical protein LX15_001451 [Streptoalloteichus tenebrarius]|uniref:DUF6545 domain-containing protein n=1 Tax=Streptoalloteichus tenebrarius (strain ATCC 17920 / DSM 40477 / JCM 4838 / CBS 697.72 / NBRC 16177 / NCIMB 11028 / NRRL B-12390 / A12253. 1 / ISP 5477) TaxID=1933 RepID=A0ABT1HQM7_STRSD|nr:DUF6545 domain-containing protein [Streptoalloteichus tenebrarius]MCP2257765.1 hypothetical protein [Streptoalloteichus tenebrarius]BFE99875.1 hypothetical protein GCM10020241_15510 [Streptoalloteichus tenebrarius]
MFRPFVALAALFEPRPLWRDITAAVPTVVMVEAHRGVTLLTAPSLRVYRTIIEIRDGLLFLRNYVSPATLEAAREHVVAHGVADDLLDATVTACWLVAALDARRRGEEPQPEPPNLVSQGGTQLDTELHFLRQHSPLCASGRRTRLQRRQHEADRSGSVERDVPPPVVLHLLASGTTH